MKKGFETAIDEHIKKMRGPKLKTPPGAQSMWEKRAKAMRELIEKEKKA